MKKKLFITLISIILAIPFIFFQFYIYASSKTIVMVIDENSLMDNLAAFSEQNNFALNQKKKLYVYLKDTSKQNIELAEFFDIPKQRILYNNIFYNFLIKLIEKTNNSKRTKKISKYINNHDINFIKYNIIRTYPRDLSSINFSFIKFKPNIKTKGLINQVSEKNSVCIFLNHPNTDTYTDKSIEITQMIINDPRYYVFSNNQSQIKIDNATYFSAEENPENLSILANCSNLIISKDSNFSLLTGYANKKNGLIIAPFNFYTEQFLLKIQDQQERYNKIADAEYIYLPHWLLINESFMDIEEIAKKYINDQSFISSTFKNYKKREFDLYTGNRIQLDFCMGEGEFNKNFCYLHKENNKPTVVTAYYSIPKAKHSENDFYLWAENFLKIPFNLVVFTDKKNKHWIKSLRKDLPITIIEKDFNDLYFNRYKTFYDEVAANDKEVNHLNGEKYHQNAGLYIVWNEKVILMNEAINLNPYRSNFFVWLDIGTIREKEYLKNIFLTSNLMVSDKITFFMNKDISNYSKNYLTDSESGVQGNLQIGDQTAWRVYQYLYKITQYDLMQNNIACGKDQSIMSTMVIRYPELFNLLYQPTKDKGNIWWYGLKYYSDK